MNCHHLHENVLNITHYQRDACQNQNEILIYTDRMAIIKQTKSTHAREYEENRQSLYTVGHMRIYMYTKEKTLEILQNNYKHSFHIALHLYYWVHILKKASVY